MPSLLESQFEDLWVNLYPDIELIAEVQLIPKRRFRFDYVHLPSKTAIEINGGNWNYGRHCRPQSLLSEYEKINLAQLQGYRVFILSGEMITTEWLEKIANHITTETNIECYN